MPNSWRCKVCGWSGMAEQFLTAPNPFNAVDTINGCPNCLEVSEVEMLCDMPDCKQAVSCGTPTPSGYRNTCSEHAPNLD